MPVLERGRWQCDSWEGCGGATRHLAKAVVPRELHCARSHCKVDIVVHGLDLATPSASLDVHVRVPCRSHTHVRTLCRKSRAPHTRKRATSKQSSVTHIELRDGANTKNHEMQGLRSTAKKGTGRRHVVRTIKRHAGDCRHCTRRMRLVAALQKRPCATYGPPSIFSSETSWSLIGVRVTVRPPPIARSLASVPASLFNTDDLPADCEPTTTIFGRAA